MAEENVDSDYHGRPYRRRYLSPEESKRTLDPEEIKRAWSRLRNHLWDVMATLPDGSWAVHARGGWHAFDKKTMRPDFDRPVKDPHLRVILPATILADGHARPVDVTVFAALCSYGGAADRSGHRWAWPSIPAIEARSAGLS